MIITIDGPVGTGKSTIAKQLAAILGFQFVDTGAMYRCLTYAIQKHRVEDLSPFLSTFTFSIEQREGQRRYFYEGEDITEKIRQKAVTSQVSEVAARREVREKLVDLQRRMSSGVDAVFEGRDMGTVVFPNAELKIFLTASPEIRAKRRYEEMQEKFPEQKLSYEELLEQVRERDLRDTTRAHSPLKQADDAHVVDSSDLTIEQVLDEILLLYKGYTGMPS